MKASVEKTKLLNRLFIPALTISALLWSYAVLTTIIDSIPFRTLPMVHLMPPTFWMGWGFLVLATIAWYFSPQTKSVHFLLALFWTLFLLIGPELMEVNARGNDTLGKLWPITAYEHGMYKNPMVGYSAFPSFHFFLLLLYKISGVGYYELAKLSALVFHLLRLVAICFLASHLFKGDKKQALFFTLLLLSFFWDNQQFDPSHQNMGMTFALFILGAFFLAGALTAGKRLLLVILYAGVVTTHPLSAITIALLLFFFLVAGVMRRDFGYNGGIRNFNLVALFGTMLVAWFLYSSDWVFLEAVGSLTKLLGIREIQTPLGTFTGQLPLSGLTTPSGGIKLTLSAILIYSFLALLIVWGLTIAARKEFWKTLSLERVFPALSALALLPIAFTGAWNLLRYYLFCAPFIAWFFAREREGRKNISVPFLLVLLGFTFTLRYYVEAADYASTADYYGSRFIVREIPSSATVVQGISYGPDFASLAFAIEAPGRGDYILVSEADLKPGEDFQFTVFSTWNMNYTLFHWGKELWRKTTFYLSQRESSIIYSNGDFQIHAYRAVPSPTSTPP